MTEIVRRIPLDNGHDDYPLISKEWLVTNGRGGYASGTIAGAATRRYHGMLIAALAAPLGRTMMLNHMWEEVRLPGGEVMRITAHEQHGDLHLHGAVHLESFGLELGLPVWHYRVGEHLLEKRVLMPYLHNSVLIRYQLIEGGAPLRLRVHPTVHFRSHEAPVSTPLFGPYGIHIVEDRYEITGETQYPPLRLRSGGVAKPAFVNAPHTEQEVIYRVEFGRGYESRGKLWSPGYFRADLGTGHDIVLIASVEEWAMIDALPPTEAWAAEYERRRGLLERAARHAQVNVGAELVLASDQFLIEPSGRTEDTARARAAGEQLRTVIAGYHWFTDWGRDTMISLEGLAVDTGRQREAGFVLRTFAHYVRDGLIPNMFPDQSTEGLYHTADATLWYFHAIDRYVACTNEIGILEHLLPVLHDIMAAHIQGTRFGIHMDPDDALLSQGAEGYQLTWMDAKVDDWVVTPRRGKAVEINALWYNALRLVERWTHDLEGPSVASEYRDIADRARASFNKRFWYEQGGYLFDVVDGEDGDDPACRPNQVFAISLPNPVLDRQRWEPVMQVVQEKLLTPFGLRSLSPDHPDYKPRYFGDLRARDAAYHQGTVWAWLIGPYIDAYLKVHPEDRVGARRLLDGLLAHLDDFGVGSIAEIFDAEPPYTPRGCIAQAWSIAEVLRCLLLTEG